MSSFGELRAILAREGVDAASWAELCALVAKWPADRLDEVVPYAKDHLEAWPDGLRVAPPEWVLDERDGLLALTRSLRINPELCGPNGWPAGTILEVAELSARAWWAGLTGVELVSQRLGAQDMARLPPAAQKLRLSYNRGIGDAGVEVLCGQRWPALRVLELSGCGITDSGLWELAACRGMPALERLVLVHNVFAGEGAVAAVEQGRGFAPGCQVITF